MNKHLLYDAHWLAIYENDRNFVYAERKNKDSVACLCYRLNKNNEYEFLIHYQPLIGIDSNNDEKCYPCLVTGSIEDNEELLLTAQRELEEEVGIVNPYDLVPKLKFDFIPSTQVNETVSIFIFDITGKEIGIPETDGSYYEQISYNKWNSKEEFSKIIFDQSLHALACLPLSLLLFEKFIEGKK